MAIITTLNSADDEINHSGESTAGGRGSDGSASEGENIFNDNHYYFVFCCQ